VPAVAHLDLIRLSYEYLLCSKRRVHTPPLDSRTSLSMYSPPVQVSSAFSHPALVSPGPDLINSSQDNGLFFELIQLLIPGEQT
jgi:hypothetical protein